MPLQPPFQPHSDGPLLRPLAQRPQAALRLYCFPPAGTGPAIYLPWADLLPPAIELFALHLPGRGSHPTHVSTTDPRRLIHEITDLITAENPASFAFFGHSVGALLAFETARQLWRTHAMLPSLLALSSFPPPHHEAMQNKIVTAVLDGLHDSGGLVPLMPDSATAEAHRKAAYYAPIVADSLLVLQHRHHEEAPLDAPLALYAGDTDPLAPLPTLTAWNDLFTQPATPHLYPGKHLYLFDQSPAITQQLGKDLDAVMNGASPHPTD
ncbi:thioesterase II family protein [Streptomyces syringium]|uniref:thioesterase II family protein n=1 Tax=Streptomyces syringium TaxID=76729 RepID=UPI003455E65B